jgi:Holliday junction resolvase RusA-like endonuclease
MVALLDVVITGQPCGKARHRTRIVTPKGKPPFVSSYVDEKDPNVSWERFASSVFRQAWHGRAPLGRVPLEVYVEAVGSRPASLLKGEGMGRLWRLAKPDGDNVLKAVADALMDGGVLLDDKVIARAVVESLVAAEGEAPFTRVVLKVLEPLALVPWPTRKTKTQSAPTLF